MRLARNIHRMHSFGCVHVMGDAFSTFYQSASLVLLARHNMVFLWLSLAFTNSGKFCNFFHSLMHPIKGYLTNETRGLQRFSTRKMSILQFLFAWFLREVTSVWIYFSAIANVSHVKWGVGVYKLSNYGRNLHRVDILDVWGHKISQWKLVVQHVFVLLP